MSDILIPEKLLVELYDHYYNPAVDYFRDKEGHAIWEKIKDLHGDFIRDVLEQKELDASDDVIAPHSVSVVSSEKVIKDMMYLDEQEAEEVAIQYGYQTRIAHRNGYTYALSQELRKDRLNLSIVGGVVTHIGVY